LKERFDRVGPPDGDSIIPGSYRASQDGIGSRTSVKIWRTIGVMRVRVSRMRAGGDRRTSVVLSVMVRTVLVHTGCPSHGVHRTLTLLFQIFWSEAKWTHLFIAVLANKTLSEFPVNERREILWRTF
jgi:hypothetical protein